MLQKVMFVYEFEGRTASEVGKINRQLFGYKDKSNHGKYIYWRNGLLSKISLKRLARGVILTDKVNDSEVLKALRMVRAKKISRYYLTVNKVVK
ncbi:MAG: hypothetical protein ABIC04_06575 [Nanoarchaeota archaeon]